MLRGSVYSNLNSGGIKKSQLPRSLSNIILTHPSSDAFAMRQSKSKPKPWIAAVTRSNVCSDCHFRSSNIASLPLIKVDLPPFILRMIARLGRTTKSRYDKPMKSKRSSSDEYGTFTTALRKVLQVSHSEMKAKLSAEKRAKKRRAKRVSSRASADKG